MSQGYSILAPIPIGAIFHFVNGHWLHDKATQLNQCYLEFNISALKNTVVEVINGALMVTSMVKLTEGAYNKVFFMVLDNHQEVVAHLPRPCIGMSHFVTASEVATKGGHESICGSPGSVPVSHLDYFGLTQICGNTCAQVLEPMGILI
jgi:hypothetical protein